MVGKNVLQQQLNDSLSHFGNNVAIEYGNTRITYTQLDRYTNYIANWLIYKKVKRQTSIGILMGDRLKFIATMVGILKAGGIFVPLDPAYPKNRLKSIIASTDIQLVFTDDENSQRFTSQDATGKRNPIGFFLIDQCWVESGEWCDNKPGIDCCPEDKVYIYFTSGTTGTPKAVLGRNRSLLHFIHWEIDTFAVDEAVRFSQFTSPGFDVFLRDVLVPLCAGGTICIPESKHILIDSRELVQWIDSKDIHLIHCVPSLFRVFNTEYLGDGHFKKLRYVLFAGERINPIDLKQWYCRMGERVQLANLYGPTETTLAKVFYFIRPADADKKRVPIGKPIRGARVIILDENMNLCNNMVIGEIYIRTPFRTFGYDKDPELNRQKFIRNPFSDDPGDIIYKTGDLGRLLPDGNIDIIGRIDRQVKIRGMRVELEEIENILGTHPTVKQAVVLKKQQPNSSECLVAYITIRQKPDVKQDLLVPGLKKFLAGELPDYMVPTFIHVMEELPVKPNGKIDFDVLYRVEARDEIPCILPRDDIERKLFNFWSEILKFKNISVKNNFFELGGNSLNVMSLAAKIHREFDVRIPLGELFRKNTLEQQAQFIRGNKKAKYHRINPVERKGYYPLTPAQKRLYILRQMEKNNRSYNIPVVLLLEGEVLKEKLEKVFRELIKRHESLRTSFEVFDETLVQRVHGINEIDFKVKYHLCKESEAPAVIEEFMRAFDLGAAPLLRVGLLHLDIDQSERSLLMVDMHHIIADGISTVILIKELMALYHAQPLLQLPVSYCDYSEWLNREKGSERIKAQEQFWLEEFGRGIPVLNLPTDFTRPGIQCFDGDTYKFEISGQDIHALRALALKEDVTLYMILLALFNIILMRLSGQEDIVVGTPEAGRRHPETHNIIGIFVNTLPLRSYPQREKSFIEFLKEIKKQMLKVLENQDYPFEELVERTAVNRDPSRNPLFDVMFILQNFEIPELEIPGLKIEPYHFENKVSKFDVTFIGLEEKERLLFTVEYGSSLFRPETIRRFITYFKKLISSVLADTQKFLGELGIIPELEKRQLLLEFNRTGITSPKNRLIHQEFETQVEKTPHNTAVIYEDKHFSFGELNLRSNQLAEMLNQAGLKRGEIVAIMIPRSLELIVGILGTLKANAVCLPLNPDYPGARISAILKDSSARVVLKNKIQRCGFDYAGTIIDSNSEKRDTYDGSNPASVKEHPAGNYAYVIYTSGSTGRPKGIPLCHWGIINHAFTKISILEAAGKDIIAHNLNIAFVASIWLMFSPLMIGAILQVYPGEIMLDSYRLFQRAERDLISLLEVVPSFLYWYLQLLEEGKKVLDMKSLRYLVLTGETVLPAVVNGFYKRYKTIPLVNAYGQSECSDDTLHYRIPYTTKAVCVPVGAPSHNTRVYILDRCGQIQPLGVSGELCICGDGIAAGYINKPNLTDTIFFRTPLAPGRRMYRSGDLARWLPDGFIQCLGRLDDQVKIRGNRIQVEEIKSHILNQDEIKEAVVIAREDISGESHLCAYIVSRQAVEVDLVQLRSDLSMNLPAYMIPSFFVQLDKLPLTPNGKVNRRALPKPDAALAEKAPPAKPSGEMETRLAVIWGKILGKNKETIGTDDHFFQLGGHSLNAALLTSRIHQDFNVKIPLAKVFQNPTMGKLARAIRAARKETYVSLEAVEQREYYPLSSAQRRLYILQKMGETGTSYNITSVFQVEGHIDRARLEKTFNRLISRHGSLRTSFHLIENQPVQKIHDEVDFGIGDTMLHASAIKAFICPFDLSQVPLLRVSMAKTGDKKNLVVVDINHIISDGISQALLVKEFSRLYGDNSQLPVLRFQYKDYVYWQARGAQQADMARQADYWLKQFSEEISPLILPYDYPRPLVREFEGTSLCFSVKRQEMQTLKQLASRQGVTLFMVLLSLYNILLSKLSGQKDIVVGTPVSGRSHADLEPIIGMFVNTLALRNQLPGQRSFWEFLETVKVKTLDAFDNQDFQYEDLVERVAAPRDAGHNPLFDVLFVLQSFSIPRTAIPGTQISVPEFDNGTAKFDLTLQCIEMAGDERWHFRWEYRTKLFRQETIDRFTRYFKELVSKVGANSQIKIADLEVLSEEEKRYLLVDLNDTEAQYPKDKSLHTLVAEQAERIPDHVALIGQIPGEETPSTYKNSRIPDLGESLEHIFNAFGGNISITTRELDRKSDQLAFNLIQKGVKGDTIVGIMVEPSVEMIIGMIGILKAGGAYLPLDPIYPKERLAYILEDSKAKLLVTTLGLSGKFEKLLIDNCQLLMVNEKPPKFQRLNKSPREANSISNYQLKITDFQLDQTNLAYIIYTSGSTGRSKGVLIQHKNIVRLLFNDRFQFDFSEIDVWTLFHSFCFDFSVWEMYGALCYGGRLVILPKMAARDPGKFLEILKREKVTVLNQTPSAFYQLMEEESKHRRKQLNLKYVIFGGEALTPGKLRRWNTRYPNTRLINMFGITETTVHVTYKEITAEEMTNNASNIGKPIPTLTTFVVDESLKLVPIGVAGELCIGGGGLARGYLNRPELTAEKFILAHRSWPIADRKTVKGAVKFQFPMSDQLSTNCFLLKETHKSYLQPCSHTAEQVYPHRSHHRLSLIYRSGDMVRILPHGDMQFLGRIDFQVKIRGFRVEPGEIELQLLSHNSIKDTLVIPRQDRAGDVYLCCYWVKKAYMDKNVLKNDAAELNRSGLRAYLLKELPEYMIPSYFVQLERIPLTPNGKVDNKALPEPGLSPVDEYTAPRNEIEKKLVKIWAEIINQSTVSMSIGIDDNFFELGGHSLKAVLLNTRIHKEFHVHVPLEEIFKNPTIRGLSKFIAGGEPREYIALEPVEEKEYYSVSPAQNRLFVVYQLHARAETKNLGYNLYSVIQINGELETKRMEQVFRQLIQRHESLRTSFAVIDGKPVQKIHDRVEFEIEYYELSNRQKAIFNREKQQPTANSQVSDSVIKDFLRPFDLSQAPLLRVGLIHLEEQKYLLMLDMHHIIADGVSLQILVEEFKELYKGNAESQLPLPGRYRDYAELQQSEKQKVSIAQQEIYWLKQFETQVIPANLPMDFPRPPVLNYGGKSIQLHVSRELCQRVDTLNQETQTTLSMIFLAVYYILLAKYSGQEDIVIGIPTAGRLHPDLQNIIGMFVNMLALRTYHNGHQPFSEFLIQVRRNLFNAYQNQEYPFIQLVNRLKVKSDLNRNPLFDAVFSWEEGSNTPGLEMNNQEFIPLKLSENSAHFDLTLFVFKNDHRISIVLRYAVQLFHEETIRQMGKHYLEILEQVVENPGIPTGQIKISSDLLESQYTHMEEDGDFGF